MNPVAEGAHWPLTITQGATFDAFFEYKDQDGVPISLVGYTAKGQVRKKEDETSDLYATFTIVVDGAAGTLSVSLTPTQTQAIPKTGYYDIFLLSGSARYLFLQGPAILDPRVTDLS